MRIKLLYFLGVAVTFYSCKTSQLSKTTPKPSLPVDSITQIIIKDSVYLITQLGDTLSNLDQEIDIELFRVLPDTISLAAVGDIMTGTNFPNESYLPKENGNPLWRDVNSILKNADITFGNLEGTILNEGGEQKECNNPKLCYLFRSPETLTSNFIDAGFDLMSVANNHANDFGKTGRLNTQRVLDSLKIGHAGSIDQPYIIKRIGRVKVGFCAFAPNRGTISIHDQDRIKEIIQHLDSLSDFTVASLHIGAEGSKHRHVTRKREFYYGEDRGNVYELSHFLIDNGVDIVLGHGPHIVRAIEVYKKRFIAYSMGNFLTYGRFNLKAYAGEAPIFELNIDSKGEFLSGTIHSFRQSYTYGPRIDKNYSALKTIQELSLEDIPESPIFISDSGKIEYHPKKE